MPTQQVPHDAVRHCAGIGPSTVPRVRLQPDFGIVALVVGRGRGQVLLVDDGESRVAPALVERHRVLRADAAKDARRSPGCRSSCARRRSARASSAIAASGRRPWLSARTLLRNAANPTCCSVISPTAAMPSMSDSSALRFPAISLMTAASSRLDGAAFDSARSMMAAFTCGQYRWP